MSIGRRLAASVAADIRSMGIGGLGVAAGRPRWGHTGLTADQLVATLRPCTPSAEVPAMEVSILVLDVIGVPVAIHFGGSIDQVRYDPRAGWSIEYSPEK